MHDVAAMCINHSCAERTGVPPFYAVFGRHPPFFGNLAGKVSDVLNESPSNMSNTVIGQAMTWADVLALHHGRILPDIFTAMMEKKRKQNEAFNENHLSSKVTVGSTVYVIDENRNSKMKPKF